MNYCCCFVLEPSPMLLDTSVTQDFLHSHKDREAESKESIYEVSEYAEDVFEYLREAEVLCVSSP